MPKFTDKFLRSLHPKAKAYFVTEEGSPGFSVRVSKQTKTFYIVKTIKGKRHTQRIGHYPTISIAKARDVYRGGTLALVDSQTDCTGLEMPLFDALKDYSRAYLRHQVRPRTAESYETLLIQFREEFGQGFNAADIKRKDLKKYFKSIANDGHPTKANRMKSAISSFYSWLIDEHEDTEGFALDVNPCLGIKSYKEEVRSRALSNKELEKLLPALSYSQCHSSMKLALATCLLTAARSGEVHGMMIEELDLKGKTWSIPKERTKNHQDHAIPLPESRL